MLPHTFMCYDEMLVLVKDNKTWEEALEHCRSLGGGDIYDLPPLITDDDHQYARERAQEAITDEVGLFSTLLMLLSSSFCADMGLC